jgi:cytochrome P450
MVDEMASFDPYATVSQADPYRVYRWLRDESPVHHYEAGRQSLWILSRYEDVSAALGEWGTFSSADSMPKLLAAHETRGWADGEQLVNTDPPYHDDLRRVVKEYLSPKGIQALAPMIEAEVEGCLALLASLSTVDIARDFAWTFTLTIISRMVGIPEGDRSNLLSWYHALHYSDGAEEAAQALNAYTEYFDWLATRRHAEPCDDLMSLLMHAERRGEISRSDAQMLCKDLFEGGVDVPANLIANSVLALAAHRDQRSYLMEGHADVARTRLAVEELARYEAPIQFVPRRVTRDVSLHNREIPKDATVLLLLGSANRDERQFANPDTLDLGRRATRNLAFGAGIHFCIGAPLARLEARLALPKLLSTMRRYDVVEPVKRPRRSENMRALLNLEVVRSPGSDNRRKVLIP